MIIKDITELDGIYNFLCIPDKEIHIDDLIRCNNTNFRVVSIKEKDGVTYLKLSPNIIAYFSIHIGNDVEIIHNK